MAGSIAAVEARGFHRTMIRPFSMSSAPGPTDVQSAGKGSSTVPALAQMSSIVRLHTFKLKIYGVLPFKGFLVEVPCWQRAFLLLISN
jgi:hypothetical protein